MSNAPRPPLADSAIGFNRWAQGLLAFAITTGFLAVIFSLMSGRVLEPTVKDILLVLLGALLASFRDISSYFFGSSAGSATKGLALEAAVAKTVTPPPIVISPTIVTPAPIEPARIPPAPSAAAPVRTIPAAPPPVLTDAVDLTVPDPSLDWPITWEGVTLLAHREALRLKPYRDITGKPTIGWGQTDGVTMDMTPWTRQHADDDLLEGLVDYTDQVLIMCAVAPSRNQLAAFVVCAWNIGLAGLRGSSMMRLHNVGDFAGAAAAFAAWNKSHVDGQLVVVQALVESRANEAALYLRRDAGAPRIPVPQTVAEPV